MAVALADGELEIDELGLTLPHPRLFERAFVLRPLAEIVLEDQPRPVGLGAGHGEDVREQAGKAERRDDADGEHGEPAEEHGTAKAEDGAGPTLGHLLRLIRRPDP